MICEVSTIAASVLCAFLKAVDCVGNAVDSILRNSQRINKLDVRLSVGGFRLSDKELFEDAKCIVEPLQRLRNIGRPRLHGLYEGSKDTPCFTGVSYPTLWSTPQLSTEKIRPGPGRASFDDYKDLWERCLSQTAEGPLPRPQLSRVFDEFKKFYTALPFVIPDVTLKSRRNGYLHRARVACETGDIIGFITIRDELLNHWSQYLECETRRKRNIDSIISQMLRIESNIQGSSQPASLGVGP